MVDRRPTNFAHMQQTVGPTQIDESAKGTQAAHFAAHNIAHLQAGEECFFLRGAVFALGQHLRHHQAPTAPIHFDHFQAHLFVDAPFHLDPALIFGKITRHVDDVRGRDKAAQAVELDGQAAFVIADYLMNRDLTIVHKLLGNDPIFLLQRVGNAQVEGAIIFWGPADNYVHRLTDVQILDKFRVELSQIRLWDYAIAFATDVNQQFCGANFNNYTFA